MNAKKIVAIAVSPEAHGKLVERAIRFGLSPTAYARLVLLRHLGADVLMLDEAVQS